MRVFFLLGESHATFYGRCENPSSGAPHCRAAGAYPILQDKSKKKKNRSEETVSNAFTGRFYGVGSATQHVCTGCAAVCGARVYIIVRRIEGTPDAFELKLEKKKIIK